MITKLDVLRAIHTGQGSTTRAIADRIETENMNRVYVSLQSLWGAGMVDRKYGHLWVLTDLGREELESHE